MNLPPELISDLRIANKLGKPVFRREMEISPGACPSCGNTGFLWFDFAENGPYKTPASDRSAVYTYSGGAWWAVKSKFYTCPTCGARLERLEELYRDSGLEEDERGWSLNYFNGMAGKEMAVEAGKQLLETLPRPAGWICFYGDYGVGKSGVLRALAAGAIQELVPSRYVRAEDILRELRATFGDDSEVGEDELMQRYGRYALLAIDEVDRVSDTKWSRSALFTLLDTRYKRREQLATLLATNCDPLQLPAGFEYLQSRMQHGYRVEMAGKDLREGEE